MPKPSDVSLALEAAFKFEERVASLERALALAEMRAVLDPEANFVCGVSAEDDCAGIGLKLGPGSVQFVGRKTCGITTICPRCGKKRLWTQRRRLEELLLENSAGGGGAILVSLSLDFPHHLSLAQRWTILRDAWGGLTASTRRRRAAAGVFRRARIVHLLHGTDGWHVHLHCVYFLLAPISDSAASTLATAEAKRWSELATQHGCGAHSDIQTYTVIGDTKEDAKRVSSYLTKAVEEIEYDRGSDSPMFTCRLDRKNKSPWQLLNDASLRGDLAAQVPLREWMQVVGSKNFKQQSIPTALNRPVTGDDHDTREVAA
ncbi:hypothetical protein [Demequina aurantiaca]|uniref:hypothetical protein n=1 Tax=Demequina aurantiaca TaxID=676200 RepID=UPI003D34C7D1